MKLLTSLLVGILAFSLSMHGVQAAGETVTVKLVNYVKDTTALKFNVTGSYQIEGSKIEIESTNMGEYSVKAESGDVVLYRGNTKLTNFGSAMTLVPTITNAMDSFVAIGDKRYLGEMKFTVDGKYIRPVNTLPMEEYLKGVVPSEMPAYWGTNGGMEALKAQAVAARTFAFPRKDNLTDSQSSQVYKGYDWYSTTNIAINETAGKTLKSGDTYIGAFYSSTNGGMVMSNTNSWGSKLIPYLQTKSDPYDAKLSPYDSWNYTLGKKQIDTGQLDLKNPESWWTKTNELSSDATEITNMKSWLKKEGKINSTDEIKITEITNLSFTLPPFTSNDILKGSMTFKYFLKKDSGFDKDEKGLLKEYTMKIEDTSYNLRFMIGTSIMKSPYIQQIDAKSDSYVVNGSGFGHGIGMSQYGAYQQSKEDRTFDEILSFYYPNTNLVQEKTTITSERLYGKSRYDTSVAISKYGWKNHSEVVVIGRGDVAIDALTGSVLAKKYNAPLLLTPSNALQESVEQEIDRLQPKKIYILGGTGAVSENIKSTLEKKLYVQEVERVSGKDRYATAVEIAEEVGGFNQAILASGNDSSPDALSIASYAAAKQIPILLTGQKSLSDYTKNYVETTNITQATLIGGTGAISDSIKSGLENSGVNTLRISGKDRYLTSVEVAKTLEFEYSNLFFANGDVFIDALPGSSLAAAMGAPVILTQKEKLPESVSGYLDENKAAQSMYLLGGTGAISEGVMNDIFQKIN